MEQENLKIKILENGPYLVDSRIKLTEVEIKLIDKDYDTYESVVTRVFDTKPHEFNGHYALCRCGGTKDAPFCDGYHATSGFKGEEVASKEPYFTRAQRREGEDLILFDDKRCAYARFCHKKHGQVWDLTKQSSEEIKREEAIEGSSACPAGRITAMAMDGMVFENEYEPEIIVSQDPQKYVSGSLWVRGNIEIEGADGEMYEVRNRVALCRCGKSQNIPFCDSRHVTSRFRDSNLKL